MKRVNYIILRSIISKVKYTIKAIILLPIRIVLFPFKLLSRAVFYLGHRNKYQRLDKDVYNELKKQSKDITKNKWDNKRAIADIKQDIVLFSSDLNAAFKSINELQLSLESLKPVDLGHIEAEALGMQVAKEEYDWTRERKDQDKTIQERMRKDEEELNESSKSRRWDD
jgi:chromosome segregation ATPase